MERLISILDSWAIIAFLRGEPAAPVVREAIEAGARCCWINLAEVLYLETRRVGLERTNAAVESFEAIVPAELPNPDLFRAAALIKVGGGVSLANRFAIAMAERDEAELLTGDPEILECQRPGLRCRDLRSS